jgi:hypothetical protein
MLRLNAGPVMLHGSRKGRVAATGEEGLGRHAGVLGVIAAHPAPEDQAMPQGRGTEQPGRPPRRQPLTGQPDGVPHRGPEERTAEVGGIEHQHSVL